ncbi:MAG: hypothetical protein JXB17_13440 [Bacteroidales bacterium]|nr:hypothetical protein [Bacteroidales bacterium]
MEKNANSIQTYLFEQISKILPSSISLVDELAEVLDISTDSVYRRLRGETALSIFELERLCKKYKLSFDSLCETVENSVTFDFNQINNEATYKNYLDSVYNEMKVVERTMKKQGIYAAKDMPLFYDFRFPLLASFKIFYWMKSILNLESFQGVKFNPEIISNEIIELGQEVYNLYTKIPSIEIWTEVSPISLFKQIEFFWDAGIFQAKDDALSICDQVKELFLLVEKQAELGKKLDTKGNVVSFENNYSLYWSEIEIGNNCILVEIDGEKIVYMGFNTFNKLSTRNKYFCNEIDIWVKNLIKKSNLISDVSEKQRYRFFKRLNEGLENTRNKIITG